MCAIPIVSCFCSFCVTWLMLLFVMSDVTNGGLREDLDNFNLLDDDITSSSTTFPSYTHPKWFEPYFDPATPRNVTALMGKSAYLSCRVRNLGNKTVSWIRHRDIHILTVGSYTYTSDQRFQATHHPDSDDWTLQIKWAQKRDAGMYECQISTQPVRSYFIRLNVVVPTATILGGPDLHVDKGSTINLTCTVKFSPEPPAYIFWYHHEEVINYDSTRGGVSVITEKGDVTTSFLLIQNADLVDSGKYSCAPSNADVASVRVHVLNGEHPEAMQTGSSGCQYSWLTIVLLMSLVFCYHQHNMHLNAEMNILNTTAATATATAKPSTIRATRTQANSSNFLRSNIYKNNVGKQKTQQQQQKCILRPILYNNKIITTRITTKTTVNPSIITSLHIHRSCYCNYEQQQQQKQQQQQQHYSHLQYRQKKKHVNNSNARHESSRHQSHQLQPSVVSVTNYCYSESNRSRCLCCCCFCFCSSYYYYCYCSYGGILWQKQSAHSVYHNVLDEKFLAAR